jgi:metal-responsive CopG/Arc/MetJ family transcriptional regulator
MDDQMVIRIDAAARCIGSNRSAVVRLAIIKFLPEIESGKITLRLEDQLEVS